MDSQQLIDAQFDRAVEIVQSLPKIGPIQTTYEEKLTMYRDAWAQHKDLDSYEAKWLYTDAMMKVLRKYSDKTVARELIQELESYGGDPSNLVMSRDINQSRGSQSSGSTRSEDDDVRPGLTRPIPSNILSTSNLPQDPEDPDTTSEDDTDDEAHPLPLSSQYTRPQSSLSSHNYRTPLGGSIMSPGPMAMITSQQQHQQPTGYETPSAFAEPGNAMAHPSAYPGHRSGSSQDYTGTPTIYNNPSGFRPPPQPLSTRSYPLPARPLSRPSLENAIENLQAHIAALNERIESLEIERSPRHASSMSLSGSGSPRYRRNGSPDHRGDYEWDLDDLGMWSLVLSPVTRVGATLRTITKFFATSEHSPMLIVVRRLCLDASFIFFVLYILRFVWRKTGVRRREVKLALKILGRALIGSQQERALTDRGV
ncbi:hypothetical protein HWV62_36149 [Athelia sp. TMB]|nr:hypothetical protein HWV62_36149 [Athelia sp. TMB]